MINIKNNKMIEINIQYLLQHAFRTPTIIYQRYYE